jgi:hypothetical protein
MTPKMPPPASTSLSTAASPTTTIPYAQKFLEGRVEPSASTRPPAEPPWIMTGQGQGQGGMQYAMDRMLDATRLGDAISYEPTWPECVSYTRPHASHVLYPMCEGIMSARHLYSASQGLVERTQTTMLVYRPTHGQHRLCHICARHCPTPTIAATQQHANIPSGTTGRTSIHSQTHFAPVIYRSLAGRAAKIHVSCTSYRLLHGY